MAKFYAQAKGNRGLVHCMGSEASGIWTSAQSYDGSVIVKLWYKHDGELMVTLNISDESSADGRIAFSSTFSDFKNKFEI